MNKYQDYQALRPLCYKIASKMCCSSQKHGRAVIWAHWAD